MVVRTIITLGSQTTPSFVSKEFYDMMDRVTETFQFDYIMKPTTIRYGIGKSNVVERIADEYQYYTMDLDDVHLIPRCERSSKLKKTIYKKRTPNNNFDRVSVVTENMCPDYFLLIPGSMYHEVLIYKHWIVRYLTYDGHVWEIHFRQVFVDPYDTSATIWFLGHAKFQIVIITNQIFDNREQDFKKALFQIIPEAFHLD